MLMTGWTKYSDTSVHEVPYAISWPLKSPSKHSQSTGLITWPIHQVFACHVFKTSRELLPRSIRTPLFLFAWYWLINGFVGYLVKSFCTKAIFLPLRNHISLQIKVTLAAYLNWRMRSFYWPMDGISNCNFIFLNMLSHREGDWGENCKLLGWVYTDEWWADCTNKITFPSDAQTDPLFAGVISQITIYPWQLNARGDRIIYPMGLKTKTMHWKGTKICMMRTIKSWIFAQSFCRIIRVELSGAMLRKWLWMVFYAISYDH